MRLEGGINFRDMGGYLTLDGRRVKKGHFFRSGSLSKLTANDHHLLQKFSVKYILDYRDPLESETDQDALWHGVHYESCPANPVSHASSSAHGEFFTSAKLEALADDFMETLYQKLPFANRAYQRLFQKIENMNEGALVQHCAVGKDRTGVGSALLLLALGVQRETIMEDYLLTEQTLAPYREKVLQQVGSQLSSKALHKFHYVMSARESFLGSAWKAIEQKYSTLDHFFEAELGLSARQRHQWQERFLEETKDPI